MRPFRPVLVLLLLTLTACASGSDDPGEPSPVLELPFAESWQHSTCGHCETWKPSGHNEVVHADRLPIALFIRAARDVVTVFVVPFGTTVPGETWSVVTKPWRTAKGHELRRLSSGFLTHVDARGVDVLTCSDCNEVVVVLAPERATARRYVEQVRVRQGR